MGKLQDYPSKSIPAAGDKFVMSNAADGNNTYSVDYIDLVNSIPGTKVPLTASTTDATANVVMTPGSDYSTALLIPINSVYAFKCRIVAKSDNATPVVCADYEIDGTISRDSTTNTTLEWSNVTTNFESPALWSCDANAFANDTTEELEIRVTGIAATNISWTATLEITKVTY